ncbi:hypothetical protein F4861DRAFT_416896 [Xylaria intraflava]|nr:hypothetical protein F4861DRAFT_416896 [Xylaria intraflava]
MSNDTDVTDLPPRLRIEPPLFNSANPWATTLEDLRSLYRCTETGAVTTRTALLDKGSPHDDAVHRYAFFEAGSHRLGGADADASLNTLGYSPVPLDGYLGFIRRIVSEGDSHGLRRKPFIVSVTGTPDEVAECYRRIAWCSTDVEVELAMEVNLSCPNIPGCPPPAYDRVALRGYLWRVTEVVAEIDRFRIPWGVKTPPYTHAGQFDMVASALRECCLGGVSSVGFVTATNTLGSCLVLEGEVDGDGLGLGDLAGAPLHPLALGNVASLRRLLGSAPETCLVQVLGIGGVGDLAGYRHMRRAGAAAVGIGTALGIQGLAVFEEIERGAGGLWEI